VRSWKTVEDVYTFGWRCGTTTQLRAGQGWLPPDANSGAGGEGEDEDDEDEDGGGEEGGKEGGTAGGGEESSEEEVNIPDRSGCGGGKKNAGSKKSKNKGGRKSGSAGGASTTPREKASSVNGLKAFSAFMARANQMDAIAEKTAGRAGSGGKPIAAGGAPEEDGSAEDMEED
jgi:hypothetical protein